MAGSRKNTTREKIKDVAQQLIAEHGVDGISIRDIIIAAGQRNMASLYYYFRSKEELIKELVYDANGVMEATRTDYLAKLEEIGEPLTVRQIVHVILSGGAKLDPSQGGRNATIMRFFGAVTHLGDPMPLTLLVIAVAVLLIARRQTSLAFAWSAACAGGAVLNRVLKQIFERVRPVHDHGFASADGFSFPSGHTSGSVVVYGMLAYLCVRLLPSRWHLPGALLAATLAFSTAWSDRAREMRAGSPVSRASSRAKE